MTKHPYTLFELRAVAKKHDMDAHHRELLLWAADRIEEREVLRLALSKLIGSDAVDAALAKHMGNVAKLIAPRCESFHPEYSEQCAESRGHTGYHVDHDGNAWSDDGHFLRGADKSL